MPLIPCVSTQPSHDCATLRGKPGEVGPVGPKGKPGSFARAIMLCSAYTPTAVGADTAEVTIPQTHGLSGTFTVARIVLRVSVAGGEPAIVIEKSIGAGAFSPVTVGSVALDDGDYEAVSTTPVADVASGNKIRFNVTELGTATDWTIIVELEEDESE